MKKAHRSIDFTTATYEELDQYGMQMLVSDGPEVSAILRGHLLVERVIEALIVKRLKYPEKFFSNHRVTFEMKVDLASALGVLPDAHHSAAKALNNIRNAFAHREDHKLNFEELNSLKIGWAAIQKKAYDAACGKGVEEAARIALIFLNWSFINLLPQANAVSKPKA